MSDMSKSVFISYRTENTEPYARNLYWELTEKGYAVFFAPKRLYGGKFGPKIIDEINAAGHFVVVLGPETLQRCSNGNDWVRLEIETAIDLHPYINIIPFHVGGFNYNVAQNELNAAGEKVKQLKEFGHITYSFGHFDEAVYRVDEFIKKCDIVFPKQQFHLGGTPVIPRAKPDPSELRATDLATEARNQTNCGNFEKAIELLTKAIELDNLTSGYINNRGYAYYKLGQKEKALADYFSAISLNRHDPFPYNNIGVISLERNDLALALADFNIALALDRAFARPYWHRANIMSKFGDFYSAHQNLNNYANLRGPLQYNHVEEFENFYKTIEYLMEQAKTQETFDEGETSDDSYSADHKDDLYYDDVVSED